MNENIPIFLLVGGALAYILYRFYRHTKVKGCTGCGCNTTEPLAKINSK
jgi:hypothetical protein